MIETYEIRDGQRIDTPPTGDGATSITQQGDGHASNGIDPQGATDSPPAGEGQPSETSPAQTTSPSPGEGEGDDEPDVPEESITASYVNARIKRLTARHRSAERALQAEREQNQIRQATLEGQLQAVQRMLAGAAPELPQTLAQPTGPPQAEQYASHEDYVLAAARYGAQQELQARDQQTAQERQQAQQAAFQQQLMERENAFKQAHPDFDSVVRSGLAGKVSPVLQQALMLVPDGPAVAYALARQPDLVTRLNTLPPPLVLVELGRISPPPTPPTPNGTAPVTNGTPPPALPAPPTPLSGSGAGAPTGSYHEGMSQEDYRRWRSRTSQLPVWKER